MSCESMTLNEIEQLYEYHRSVAKSFVSGMRLTWPDSVVANLGQASS